MSIISIDQVVSALRSFPQGASTKELAAKLGMHQHSLGSRLSKYHLYGKHFDREFRNMRIPGERGRFRESVWRVK